MTHAADTGAPEYILELSGISKRFGGIQALKNTSLRIRKGKIIALVGENGAGKSTLINIISGLFRPDTGTITLDGGCVSWSSPAQALRHGIAVVHQELTLFPNLTVSENVFVGNERAITGAGRLNRPLMRDETTQTLGKLGLKIPVDRYAGELSLAEQQLVEIAKALAWKPRLLILDEATSALDTCQVSSLFEAIRSLRDEGVTILFVSHRMYEITELCDQALVLKDGMIMAEFDDEAMKGIQEKTLVEAMVGEPVDQIFPEKSGRSGSEALLSVEHLSNCTLRDVNLSVYPGEIVGLGGLRGHGQEEFLRTLFGLSQVESGSIALEKVPYVPRDPIRAIRRGLAYIPPDRKTEGIAQLLSVEFNLSSVVLRRLLEKKFGVIDNGRTAATISELREELNIGQRAWRQEVSSLSGGNQQKVVLGKWLKSGYKILLMDEPTRGIDVVTKHEIYGYLRELTKTGISILAVSTDALELLGISDRIYVFYEGSIQALLEGDTLNETSLTRAIMGM